MEEVEEEEKEEESRWASLGGGRRSPPPSAPLRSWPFPKLWPSSGKAAGVSGRWVLACVGDWWAPQAEISSRGRCYGVPRVAAAPAG